jgi:putative peptidoglycan lipid II flippase
MTTPDPGARRPPSATLALSPLEPDADQPDPAPVTPPDPAPAEGLVRSSGVVAAGTLLSRVTGLARTIMTAVALGGVGIGSAYNLANNTPNMIYDLLVGGVLSATLVPALVGNRDRGDDDGNDAVLTVATVVLLVITAASIVAAPVIVHAYAAIGSAGSTPPTTAEQDVAVTLLRLFAPQILFYGLSTLGTALLNTHRRFAAAAFAPVVNNLWMIVILLAAWRAVGSGMSVEQAEADHTLLLLLGLGTTLGIVAMTLVLVPAIRRADIPLRWNFDLHHPAVHQVARLSGWTIGYVVANQITLFVIVGLAYGTPGNIGVAAWNYAYQFFQLPYGVFTVSIMTAFTPELASLASRRSPRAFNDRFLMGFRLVTMLLLPSSVLFVFLARPIVSALLVHGAFTTADAVPTAGTMVALAWGMLGFSIYLYVLRGFYAHKDTRTPFLINLGENALTLLFAFAFTEVTHSGVEGLAWSWSLAYTISAVGAFLVLRRRVGPFGLRAAVATTAPVARMVLAAVWMAAVVSLIAALGPTTGSGAWVTMIVGSVFGLACYGGILAALGVRDLREAPNLLRRRGAATAA